MTDEQVKKGLDCCAQESQESWCGKCPYYKHKESLLCTTKITKDALALINRLEEENKKLSDKNKELRALCREKSNGMKLDKWVRMTREANYGIKLVSSKEIENQIREETLREVYKWMMENAVYSEEEGFAKEFAKAYGIEVEE